MVVEGRGRIQSGERGGACAHQPAKVTPVVQLMGCNKNGAETVPEREEERRKREKEESRSGSRPRPAYCRPIRFVRRRLGGNGTHLGVLAGEEDEISGGGVGGERSPGSIILGRRSWKPTLCISFARLRKKKGAPELPG